MVSSFRVGHKQKLCAMFEASPWIKLTESSRICKWKMLCTHDLTSIRPDDINDIDDIIQIDDTMILIILASF